MFATLVSFDFALFCVFSFVGLIVYPVAFTQDTFPVKNAIVNFDIQTRTFWFLSVKLYNTMLYSSLHR